VQGDRRDRAATIQTAKHALANPIYGQILMNIALVNGYAMVIIYDS